MNTGAIGHLGSAATVAASSFGMKITDPRPFLDAIDQTRLREILGSSPLDEPKKSPIYVEPGQGPSIPAATSNAEQTEQAPNISPENQVQAAEPQPDKTPSAPLSSTPDIRQGKVQRLGDFIDTDAVSALTSYHSLQQF
jgi:hypothetical protein